MAADDERQASSKEDYNGSWLRQGVGGRRLIGVTPVCQQYAQVKSVHPSMFIASLDYEQEMAEVYSKMGYRL